MIKSSLLMFLVVLILLSTQSCKNDNHSNLPPVKIGSKVFNENYILAEMFALLLENHGRHVIRKFGMGGTMICYRALENGEIDLYPEYTGTIERVILRTKGNQTISSLNRNPQIKGKMEILFGLGFNNTYAIGINRGIADRWKLEKISDLNRTDSIRYGFNPEFTERPDGWPAIMKKYGIRAIPLIYFMRNGKIVDRVIGKSPESVLESKIRQLLKPTFVHMD